MIIRVILAFIGLIAVIGGLGGIKVSQIGSMMAAQAAFKPPPESVTTTKLQAETWSPLLSAVGTLVAQQSVVVSSEVPGSVTRLEFESGQSVKKNDTLISMDTSIERAQLASAQAGVDLARITLKRTRNLGERKVRTQAQLEAAEAEYKRAEATETQIRAQIAKKTIRAPFQGKLGIRQVDIGEIVSPGQPLVSLQAIESLFVDFYLPQQDVVLIQEGQDVIVSTDAINDRTWSGKIHAIEPSVEVATRNIRVRAEINNTDFTLRPGMFVEVAVALPNPREVKIVPETAILFAPYGNTVFIVKDGVAKQVLVTLGERRGDYVAIEGPIEPGTEIVTAGAFKLRDGIAVLIDNEKKIGAAINPKPEDR